MMLADEYSSRDWSRNLKLQPLTSSHSWYCLYADSPATFSAVHRGAFTLLADIASPGIDDVKLAIELAYKTEIGYSIERDVLGPLVMSRDEFKNEGLSKLGADIFARKVVEIESIQLPLQLIVVGFADNYDAKMAHVFSVNERGQCSERDMEGFCAIGSGSWAATGYLSAKSGFLHAGTIEEVIYYLCEAKFVSETSRYVGFETVVFVIYDDGRERILAGSDVDRLRAIWKRRARRMVPTAGRKIISDGLTPWVRQTELSKVVR
jgi:hypothetical protein